MHLNDKKRALLEKLLQEEGLGSDVAESIPHVEHHGFPPLSFAQERLWLLNQLQPDSPVYNFPAAVRLSGRLDVPALQAALDKVIARHDILRASFTSGESGPEEGIAPAFHLPIEIVDFSALPESAREQEALAFANAELRRPFVLATPPLLRAYVISLSPEEAVFMLVIHHIIAEVWSVALIFREIEQCYDAELSGLAPALPPNAIQYADFANWQREQMRGARLATELAYWKEQLAGELPVLRLPTDRPRPSAQTLNGAWSTRRFPAELYKRLLVLGQENGATLFMTLLAGFAAMLSRYSGQGQLLIGSPVAGRTRAETESLVGLFVNTVVLRLDLTGNPSFSEVLGRVRKVSIGAFAHQEVPFEKLVEEIRPERSLSNTPVFQVMFSLQNTPSPALRLEGLRHAEPLTPREIHNGGSKVDLALFVEESGGSLTASFEFCTDLFEATTVERMLEQLQVLLTAAVSSPDCPALSLPLLTENERRLLLSEWNGERSALDLDRPVHVLVAEQARRTPDARAVVCAGEELTYRELDDRTNRLARYLMEEGVGPDTSVGVCCERNLWMPVAMLAILKAGAAYLPLDPNYPEERLRFMLRDARAPLVLSETHLAERLSACESRIVCLDRDWPRLSEFPCDEPGQVVAPQNLAYVIYTSGSTGRPKGVAVPHESLLNLVFWHRAEFAVTSADRATQIANMAFDASVWEVWPYLTAGACLYLAPPEVLIDSARLRDWLVASSVTLSFVPTPLAAPLLDLEWPEDVALRVLLTGGDRLQSAPQKSLPFALINNYGPTENAVVATSGIVGPVGRGAPGIGRPIRNCQIYVLDKELNLAPIGVAGELCVGGASLARGYLNRADLTAEKFIPNPFGEVPGARLYRTGDLTRFRPDGSLEFLGRMDDQVKMRGFRIELGEIEAALAAVAGVKQAAVAVKGREPNDRRLTAYLVCDGEDEVTPERARRHLEKTLPGYMLPSAWVFLRDLPLTQNGKIDRKVLPEPGPAEAAEEVLLPRNPVEEIVAGVWAEVLQLEKVGVENNFFDLGGHSLMVTQILTRIRALFRVELPLRTLFENPTVASVSAALVAHEKTPDRIEKMAEMLKKIKGMSSEEKQARLKKKQPVESVS